MGVIETENYYKKSYVSEKIAYKFLLNVLNRYLKVKHCFTKIYINHINCLVKKKNIKILVFLTWISLEI